MTPDVIKLLSKKDDNDPFHNAILTHCKSLVKMSRNAMSKRYPEWDNQDDVFRGLRTLDKDDLKQKLEGKPEKMIVPNTFAQVMTFSSTLFMLFNQNRTFYELQPTGDEDYGNAFKDCELVLQRDIKKNAFNATLFQHLLDIARFGVGINELSWQRQVSNIWVTPPPNVINIGSASATIEGVAQWQQFIKFEGNLIRPVSPYRFFPDTRLPITDFTRGEFVASEEEYTKAQLRDMESASEVAGVEFIQPLPRNWSTARGGDTRTMTNFGQANRFITGSGQSEGVALITKCQVRIVPSQFKVDHDKYLGDEDFRVLYNVWYANDSRVIKLERANAWHDEFSYTVGQFTPDMQHTVNLGLADLIYRLQEVMSWFVNSHITSVRRVMNNRLIVNPRFVDTKTLDGEKDIYMRPDMQIPFERALKQLEVQDVTGQHMNDVDILGRLMQVVTGVNDNAMGQYNQGRRSAAESNTVTSGAMGRMKMHGQLIWETSLGRQGRLMLSNSRQSLSMESFVRAIGKTAPDMQQRFMDFQSTPEDIVAGDDYMIFDSTSPSEKVYQAQALQELVVTILGNPMAAQQLDLDPRAMINEIQYLRGAGNTSRFSLSQRVAAGQATPLPGMPVPGAPPQVLPPPTATGTNT